MHFLPSQHVLYGFCMSFFIAVLASDFLQIRQIVKYIQGSVHVCFSPRAGHIVFCYVAVFYFFFSSGGGGGGGVNICSFAIISLALSVYLIFQDM